MADTSNIITQLQTKITALDGTETLQELMLYKQTADRYPSLDVSNLDTKLQTLIDALADTDAVKEFLIASRAAPSRVLANDVGRLPVLDVKKYTGALAVTNDAQRFDGYLGNGDYVQLPDLTTDPVEYFNSSGVSQWTVAKTDIHANVDQWVGFFFDDSKLYIVAKDTITVPHTFYTASVDGAGTITNIGNAAPSTNFTAGTNFNAQSNSSGSSQAQRANIGSGNIYVTGSDVTNNSQFMEINISNGAIVSDPAVVSTPNFDYVPYRAPSGVFYQCATGAPYVAKGYVGHTPASDVALYGAMGAPPLGQDTKLIQWQGEIQVVSRRAGSASGVRRWDADVFHKWVDDLYALGGY